MRAVTRTQTPALLSPCWPPASPCVRRCVADVAHLAHAASTTGATGWKTAGWSHAPRRSTAQAWRRRGGGVAEAWRRRGGGGEYRCGLFLVAARQGLFLVRGSRPRPKSNEYIIQARYIYNWKVCVCRVQDRSSFNARARAPIMLADGAQQSKQWSTPWAQQSHVEVFTNWRRRLLHVHRQHLCATAL